jgi:hypothetical protein
MPTETSGTLSDRDSEILRLLVKSIRVLSIPQLARTWWTDSPDPESSAWNRVKSLQRAGFADAFSGLAHPELPLKEPICRWSPGQPSPSAGAISYRLQNRWNAHPQATKCITASSIARRHFGGSRGRKPRERELTHDIHLSAIYLHLRQADSTLVRYWAYEDTIVEARGHRREKLPDAIIVSPDVTRVIEFGGAYGKQKVQAFHNYCEEQSLSYEIW